VDASAKQGLVAEVFAAVAPQYDLMNDLMSGGLHRAWKQHLVSTLRPQPGQLHLDVAGGTGDVAFSVLAAMRRAEEVQRQCGRGEPPGGAGTVIVSDINLAMLAEGRKRADAAGRSSLAAPLDEQGHPLCVSRLLLARLVTNCETLCARAPSRRLRRR
jgi:2-methoxy-6-polyprenyl-1,4-benzoquinol methylase